MHIVWQGQRHADVESSDEDEWSDEEDTDTPIDSVDPFVVFADAIRQLQVSGASRFQVGHAASSKQAYPDANTVFCMSALSPSR